MTNYAISDFVPTALGVEIIENTSWSCAHGIERWQADCGCPHGGQAGVDSAVASAARAALDWLGDQIRSVVYPTRHPSLVRSLGSARDYIDVLLNHTPEQIEEFCDQHARKHSLQVKRGRFSSCWKCNGIDC